MNPIALESAGDLMSFANQAKGSFRRRWIMLGVAIVLLAGIGASLVGWYSGYRDWHKQKPASLFAEIEPAEGAVVYASDAWVRWSSPLAAKGRVLWRKAGGSRVQTADAGSGQELLAHLGPLSAGSKYEYIVEESDGSQSQRSSVRTLIVKSGLAFESVTDQTVDHDYDQSVKLTLRNSGSQPVTLSAKALKQFDDLPADVTGYGSVEVPAQIAPNSTLDLRLAVTAADATRDTYEIPIEAAGAYVTARFHVRIPKLNLSFRVVNEDPKTLEKTVEIQNDGDTLTDLAVHPVAENQEDLEVHPSANHMHLFSHQTVRFSVAPVLYLEFQALKAEIEAAAAGQSARFPLEFKAPAGMQLIAYRSASITSSSGKDWYCTNKPNTCSTVSGPPGSGPQTGAAEDPPSPEPGGCDPPKCNVPDACEALQSIVSLISDNVDGVILHRPTFGAFVAQFDRLFRRLDVDLACRLGKQADPGVESLLEKIHRDRYFKSLNGSSWKEVPTSVDCGYETPGIGINPTAEDRARCADYHAIEDIKTQAAQLADLLGCSKPKPKPQPNSGSCPPGTAAELPDADKKALDQVEDGLKEAIKKVKEETDDLDKAHPNPPIGSDAWNQIQAANEKLGQLQKAWGFWKQIRSATCVPPDVLTWLRQVMADPSQSNCNNLCVSTADWVANMSGGSDFQKKTFTEICMNACGGFPHLPSQ